MFGIKIKVNTDLFKKNKKDENLNKLDENGELPCGWYYNNKEFTDKISNEYSYFLHQWIDSRNTRNEYGTLKSLILYIEKAKKLCESIDECHAKWFTDCITDDNYINKRKAELSELEKKLRG